MKPRPWIRIVPFPAPLVAIVVAGLILLGVVLAASLLLGAHPIPARTIIASLTGAETGPDAVIVRDARLPRTLAGLSSGIALGIAGALIQAITRNPLAEPGLLGINAGAGLAVALLVWTIGPPPAAAVFGAGFAGGLVAALLALAIGGTRDGRCDPARILLAGVAVNAVAGGLTSALALLDPVLFDRMRLWTVGTLDARNLGLVLASLPVVVAVGAAALLLGRGLNALALGGDMAEALGARPERVQVAAVLLVALLCGTSTAIAGPIGFVGLMVPHIARRLAGQDMRRVLPVCAILAPLLVLTADIAGRFAAAGELRVSIVTALLGGPLLIVMARRRESR